MVLEKIYVGITMANRWSDPTSLLIVSLAGGIPLFVALEAAIALTYGVVYAAVLPIAITVWYKMIHLNTPAADTEAFLIFKVRESQKSRDLSLIHI